MAFRALATNSWRSITGRGVNGKRSFAAAADSRAKSGIELKGQFAPVYVMLGMVVVALTIGTHTAKQQLMHSPGVYVSKKKRESVPEVEDPDPVISSADKFINKSFLRKVAHVQDPSADQRDPVRADPFTRPRNSETLKSAGVEPRRD